MADPAADPSERRFGWSNMFVHPDDDPRRTEWAFEGERTTLAGYLRDQRLTLELKCAGLGTPTAWPAGRCRRPTCRCSA